MASPPRNRRCLKALAPPLPGQAPILTDDDLLADTLIRLPTLAELGRACTVCVSFRRVITDPSFLRRLRAIHPPLLLGLLPSAGGFHAAEPSHPSAPAARAADFGFSFLPSPGLWVVRDVRYGRVLLDRDDRRDGIFTKLAVCDPLFRRYVLLPPIPKDLAASVQQPHRVDFERGCEVFLVPCGEEENAAAAHTTFTVIWMAPNYAYGCFYWMMAISANLLELDMGSSRPAIVGRNPPLYFLLGVDNGRVLLQGTLEYIDEDCLAPNFDCISLEFNTLQHERVCGMIDNTLHPLPFLSYPPSLSSRSI